MVSSNMGVVAPRLGNSNYSLVKSLQNLSSLTEYKHLKILTLDHVIT